MVKVENFEYEGGVLPVDGIVAIVAEYFGSITLIATVPLPEFGRGYGVCVASMLYGRLY